MPRHIELMFRSILAAAAAAALTIAPAAASPVRLVEALENHGVRVYMDHPRCEEGTFEGVYNTMSNQMLICAGGGTASQLTPEEAITLRHEAVHVVQDCHSKGGIASPDVAPLMTDQQLEMMIELSGVNAEWIESAYRSMGADDFVVRIELEAWSLQEVATEQDVIDALDRVCSR